jgi:hypothetical protein
MPRLKAGHRTVLTNRAIRAFFPCKADAIHTGWSRLMPTQQILPLLRRLDAEKAVSLQRDLWKAVIGDERGVAP